MSGEEEKQERFSLFDSRSNTKLIAIGAILAAIYAVMVILPISAFIGAGSILSGAIFIAPLFGIVLGPRYGAIFGAIGGVLATIVSIQFGGLYLVIPTIIAGPAISGFLTGLCLKRKTKIGGVTIPGPLLTSLYLLTVIVLYLIPNFTAWWFIAPYILALVVALVLQIKEVDIDSLSATRLPIGLLFLTLIGTMTDFSMMTLGSVYILFLPADLFGFVIFPIMLVERTVSVIISTLIAAIILKVFKNEF